MVKLTSTFAILALLYIPTNSYQTNQTNVINRNKRWLIFPKGSSLQLVYCFLISTYGTKAGIFTVGITVGLAWEIPIDVRKYIFFKDENKVHDMERRDLFAKIESFIDAQGHQGETCVLRAICETRRKYNKELTFMQAIVFEIFTLENLEFWTSHEKYFNTLNAGTDCAKLYSCHFSFYREKDNYPN